MKALSAFSHKSTSSHYDLQRQHPDESPSDRLEKLAHLISSSSSTTTEDEAGPSSFFDEEINVFDAYGDYTLSPEESKLRQFESEIAQTFGKEDAVFMPSGVMAQSIALLIHSSSASRDDMPIFACHSSSHLLLHEEKSYHYLLNMKPLIIPDTSKTTTKTTTSPDLYGVPPMTFQDVQETISSFLSSSQTQEDNRNSISTLILELPHRELGGKLTPLEDIEKISKFLHSHNIKFHCDGARIFEAHAAYNYHQGGAGEGEEVLSLQDLSSHFDSIYVSFYKGLGGLTGACLLGDKDFCDEARTWLTRMGGNLYTKLPYYASAWVGFRQNYVYHRRDDKKRDEDGEQTKYLSFLDRTIQMRKVIQTISSIPNLQNYITFEPAVSEANMNHLYLKKEINIDGQKKKLTLEDYIEAREHVLSMHGIHIFPRVRPVEQTEEEESDFVGKIEYTIGNVNGNIPIDVWEKGWTIAIDYLYSKYV